MESIKRQVADPGTITQRELSELANLQEAEWLASRIAQEAILDVEKRIGRRAQIEPGPLHFDENLRMVRSKKQEGAG